MRLLRSRLSKLTLASLIAGFLYNSWPIGHWLNLPVSKTSLASGLEAVGQPYNWLFIGGDIASGILVILICLAMWKIFMSKKNVLYIRICLVAIILFGVGTIIDATLPEKCVQGLEVCPSFTQDHLLLFHGLFSIIASVFLFISLCILWFNQRNNILINILLLGYILFGLISLIEAIAPGQNGNWSQNYYITLCSVWLVVIPYAIYLNEEY